MEAAKARQANRMIQMLTNDIAVSTGPLYSKAATGVTALAKYYLKTTVVAQLAGFTLPT